jgi:mannose-6-phosphate isomerase
MSTTPRYVNIQIPVPEFANHQLWMGTHPTNPSKIYGSDQLLSAFLSDKKDLLGAAKGFEPPFDGHKAEEGHVPFLFKILCANQGKLFLLHEQVYMLT